MGYEINKIIQQMKNIQTLQKTFNNFESQLSRREENKIKMLQKQKEQLLQLQENFQERNNSIISKMQELKRKQTLLITLKKIQPEVPQNFPKNYFCQLSYEDTVLTGTQKFTDFDQNQIQEKFVLPLLFSSIVKVQIWTGEEDPILWAKSQINLQKDIQTALVSEACEGQIQIISNTTITYRLQLQGIGFSTWLRNIIQVRQLQIEKAYSRDQAMLKKQQMKQKRQEQKLKFKEKFDRKNKQSTNEYTSGQVDRLLQQLKTD